MSPIRRRLWAGSQGLVLLVLAFTGVVVSQVPAHACSCVAQTFKDQSAAADAVFTGSVDSVSEPSGSEVTYEVTADRAYKGELPGRSVTVTSRTDSASCGLGDLETDRPHVFLVARSGDSFSADSCSGTAPVSAKVDERLTRLLGRGTPVPESPPASATYTPLETSAPPPLERLAAPGAALVIIGLLGLVVVRRLGRR